MQCNCTPLRYIVLHPKYREMYTFMYMHVPNCSVHWLRFQADQVPSNAQSSSRALTKLVDKQHSEDQKDLYVARDTYAYLHCTNM